VQHQVGIEGPLMTSTESQEEVQHQIGGEEPLLMSVESQDEARHLTSLDVQYQAGGEELLLMSVEPQDKAVRLQRPAACNEAGQNVAVRLERPDIYKETDQAKSVQLDGQNICNKADQDNAGQPERPGNCSEADQETQESPRDAEEDQDSPPEENVAGAPLALPCEALEQAEEDMWFNEEKEAVPASCSDAEQETYLDAQENEEQLREACGSRMAPESQASHSLGSQPAADDAMVGDLLMAASKEKGLVGLLDFGKKAVQRCIAHLESPQEPTVAECGVLSAIGSHSSSSSSESSSDCKKVEVQRSTEVVEIEIGSRHTHHAVEVVFSQDTDTTQCDPAGPKCSDGNTAELLPAIPVASEAATAAVQAETVTAPIVATPQASSSGPIKAPTFGVGIGATAAELGG